jgi:hypothetical protein
MTDHENSSGGFLERWSRRKIEAERQTPDGAREDVAARVPEQRDDNNTAACAGEGPERGAPRNKAPTDVRAFLAPGVPAELTRAALRRAWTTDPAIRDFKGLAENDWDFTDPKAMAGFTDLPADYDVKKLVAQIFGEKDTEADPAVAAEPDRTVAAVQASEQPKEIAAADEALPAVVEEPTAAKPAPAEQVAPAEVDLVHRNNNTAMHNSNSPDGQEEAKTRRTHGRALPQ